MQNGFIKRNQDCLLTESVVDTHADPVELLRYLRALRTTGNLTFYLVQGGVREVVLQEKTKASEEQRPLLREVLGME